MVCPYSYTPSIRRRKRQRRKKKQRRKKNYDKGISQKKDIELSFVTPTEDELTVLNEFEL